MSSLANALILIKQALAGHSVGVSFTELHRGTGIAQASAHRIAKELVELGLLEYDSARKTYRGGLTLASLGFQVISSYDIRAAARAPMQDLHDRLGNTVTLGIQSGHEGVYIDKIEDEELKLRLHSAIGKAFPLHCTAMGKVMLAVADDGQRRKILKGPLEAFTPRTITDPVKLEAELAEIEKRGYAIDNEEITRGLICVAAPIYAVDGRAGGALAGALSFTCEKHIFKTLTAKTVAAEVVKAAQRASGQAA